MQVQEQVQVQVQVQVQIDTPRPISRHTPYRIGAGATEVETAISVLVAWFERLTSPVGRKSRLKSRPRVSQPLFHCHPLSTRELPASLPTRPPTTHRAIAASANQHVSRRYHALRYGLRPRHSRPRPGLRVRTVCLLTRRPSPSLSPSPSPSPSPPPPSPPPAWPNCTVSIFALPLLPRIFHPCSLHRLRSTHRICLPFALA